MEKSPILNTALRQNSKQDVVKEAIVFEFFTRVSNCIKEY